METTKNYLYSNYCLLLYFLNIAYCLNLFVIPYFHMFVYFSIISDNFEFVLKILFALEYTFFGRKETFFF